MAREDSFGVSSASPHGTLFYTPVRQVTSTWISLRRIPELSSDIGKNK